MTSIALIKNNIVINKIVASLADAVSAYPDLTCIASDVAAIGEIYDNGQFIRPQPPQPSPDEIQKQIVDAAQQRLDDFARTRNYDNILSACTYATSTVPKFAAEGQYCVNARDATWAKLYEILAEVEAGTRPMPSGFADIEPLLPVLEWPA